MDERKVIEDKLKKKEQEIQSLEDRLRAAKVYVQALQDVLRVLSTDAGSPRASEAALKTGSAVAQVRELIITSKNPMHINQLIEKLGKDATRESRASLTSSLAAYVRRGEIFTRPAPNTFGLIELGHTAASPASPPQPPQGFGKIVPAGSSDPRREVEDEIPFGNDDEIKF